MERRTGNIGESSVFQTRGERAKAVRRESFRCAAFPSMRRIFVPSFPRRTECRGHLDDSRSSQRAPDSNSLRSLFEDSNVSSRVSFLSRVCPPTNPKVRRNVANTNVTPCDSICLLFPGSGAGQLANSGFATIAFHGSLAVPSDSPNSLIEPTYG